MHVVPWRLKRQIIALPTWRDGGRIDHASETGDRELQHLGGHRAPSRLDFDLRAVTAPQAENLSFRRISLSALRRRLHG